MKRKTSRQVPVFVTLGPAGTNHEMVTRNYLSFRGLDQAAIELVDDFVEGLQMMADGAADFMVQAAVHPDCADMVARAHFKHGIRIIDTFISPSKALGILTQADVAIPRTLALQPATRAYANTDAWTKHVSVSSISRISEGLLSREYESGLTTLELADQHPGRFRVDQRLGTVDDPWLVYGGESVCNGKLKAWPSSPANEQFARLAASI